MNWLLRAGGMACLSLALLSIAQTAPADRRLTPLPTFAAKLTPPADPDHLRFAVGGDNRSTSHSAPMPPALAEICREIGILRPDLVLWTGDTIHGYDESPTEAAAEYRTFLGSAATCGVPFFNVIGNHELGTEHHAKMERVYTQQMGPLYGSFDYGHSHFVGLDTTPVIDGEAHGGELDEGQLAWLEADLAAHQRTARNIFVLSHHYVFGPADPDIKDGPDTGFKKTELRDRLHRLFVKYGVRAVFSGHAHLYWHAAKEGVQYFIAGNAGAPLEATGERGGFLGYLTVQVDGTQLTTRTMGAWTLFQRLVSGGDGRARSAVVEVDNYNHAELTARGISVTMPADRYQARGSVNYKGKSKDVEVRITGAAPLPGGTVRLTLETVLTSARTTHISVSPAGN